MKENENYINKKKSGKMKERGQKENVETKTQLNMLKHEKENGKR